MPVAMLDPGGPEARDPEARMDPVRVSHSVSERPDDLALGVGSGAATVRVAGLHDIVAVSVGAGRRITGIRRVRDLLHVVVAGLRVRRVHLAVAARDLVDARAEPEGRDRDGRDME